MPYRVERIEPNKTALIVVDMQHDFLEFPSLAARAAQVILPNLRRAIAFCRQNEIRIVYTTHVHRHDGTDLGLFAISSPKIASGAILADGSPGAEIHTAIAPVPGEIVIKKHRFSAFYGTDLAIVLRGLGVDTVVIAGVTTENCCHATRVTRFFATIRWCFCPMPRVLATTSMWGRVGCLVPMCTRLRWWFSPTQRPMFYPRTTFWHGQQSHS